MKRMTLPALLVLSLLLFSGPPAVAQQATVQSPSKFVLKAISETTGIGTNITGSLSIDKVLPDGAVLGKVTFLGPRCGAQNADFTGRIDGDKLSIPMPFEPAVQCKGIVYEFTKREGGRFEGKYSTTTSRGGPVTLKITLDPAP